MGCCDNRPGLGCNIVVYDWMVPLKAFDHLERGIFGVKTSILYYLDI